MLEQVFGLDGKVAIVTGAGTGIGRATAFVLSRAGAAVALAGRTAEPLAATRALIAAAGGRSLVVPADVADEDAVRQLVAATLAAFGRIDVLVNNAGIAHPGQMAATTAADWDRVLAVNLKSAFLCSQAVFPVMRAQGSGVVVNVASISGQTGGLAASASYAASKGGMIAFTKALARQMAPWGRANAVAPGQIETRMGASDPERVRLVVSLTPLGRLGRPEEVAHAILFLASPAASFITGHTLNVNGGILMD